MTTKVVYQPVTQVATMDDDKQAFEVEANTKVSFRHRRRKIINIVVCIILIIIIVCLLTVVILLIAPNERHPEYVFEIKQANITGLLTIKNTTSTNIEEDFKMEMESLFMASPFASVYNKTIVIAIEGDPKQINFIVILSDVGDDLVTPSMSLISNEPKDAYDFLQKTIEGSFKKFVFDPWILDF